MFPSFTTVDNAHLLANFFYEDMPQDVSQNVAYALMQEKGAVVIDVRSEAEYKEGHIYGAYNFPLETLMNEHRLDVLKENNTPVLLYCRSGRRSGMAAEMLYRKGFLSMMNFGGVLTWEYGFTYEDPSIPFEEAVKNVKLYEDAL